MGAIIARPLRARLSNGWKTLLYAMNPAQGGLWQRPCSQYWIFHEKENSLATPLCEPLSNMGSTAVLPQMCVWVTKSFVPVGINFQSCQKHHKHKQIWRASFRGTQCPVSCSWQTFEPEEDAASDINASSQEVPGTEAHSQYLNANLKQQN